MTKEMDKDPMVRLGNQLFHFKRLYYFIPIFLLLAHAKHTIFPFGSHFYDEVFEFSSLGIALLGMMLRLWASGSSRRHLVCKSDRYVLHFENKGVFSIMRNPHFVGDLLVIIGLSIPLFSLHLFILSLSLYLLVSIPMLRTKEKLMTAKFPEHYSAYCRKLPLLFPNFKHWEKSNASFHWLIAFQKEGALLVMLGALFYFIEQIRDIFVEGSVDANPIWILSMLPFILLFVFLSALDPKVRNFQSSQLEFPD